MLRALILYLNDLLTPPEYQLVGKCLKCGKCCRLLYSLDTYTTFDFKITQFLFPSYRRFEVIGKDEDGNLMFRCKWIKDDNTCGNYKKRLSMCKKFPNVKYGSLGKVPDGCGYKLVPIRKFKDVYTETAGKKKLSKILSMTK